MTERQARAYRAMSPEQRAAVDRIRASHATPEHRDVEDRVREAIEAEFPPLVADPETVAALALLRVERERRGLSLADVSERAGIDRTALSKLERGQGNPTLSTLNRVASALGMRRGWTLVVLHKHGRLWEGPSTGLEMAIRRIFRSDLLLMSGTSFPRLSNLGELDGPIGHPKERLHAGTLGSRGDGDRRSP